MDYDHPQHIKRWNDLGDFKNRGTPKSSILMVFFHYKPSFGGTPIYGTPLIFHHKPSSYWGTLDRDAFTHRPFYTNTRFFTQTLLHTETFTQRRFYTQTLLHTEAFSHRPFYTQTS